MSLILVRVSALYTFSAFTVLVAWQEGHLAWKMKTCPTGGGEGPQGE